MKELLKHSFEKALNYKDYLQLMAELVIEEKTTGTPDSERINFTKLNYSRMTRLNKTLKLPEEQQEVFKKVETKQTWLVFLESWCADGAQTIPVLNRIAEVSENISLKIILRDEHAELMDHFLTEGTRSIPKLVILDTNLEVMETWGPRSAPATKMLTDYKNEFGKIDSEFKTRLQVWYNKDRGMSIINELADLVLKLEKDRFAAV